MQCTNHSEGEGFTYIWRIENVRYCIESKGECLESPPFSICRGKKQLKETTWCLKLYPRGDDVETHIACFLQREVSDDRSKIVCVNYELALGTPNGFQTIVEQKRSFCQGQKHGNSRFLQRDEIFNVGNTEYLAQNALTIRCSLSRINNKPIHRGHCGALTRIRVKRNFSTWAIGNFSSIQINKKIFKEIEVPSMSSKSLLMPFYLSGVSITNSRVKIEVCMEPASHPIYIFLKMYVVDANHKQKFIKEDEYWFSDTSDQNLIVWHLPFNVDRKILVARKKEFLPNDILSLRFEFTFSLGIEVHSIEFICDGYHQFLNPAVGSSQAENNAGNTSNHLFSDDQFCDAFIYVQGKTIPVYKVVLCNRSPIFRRMFDTEMKEKETNLINISDFDKDTVKRFVDYLNNLPQNDTFENLGWKCVIELYKIGNKYLVAELKKDCASYFRLKLSESNVIEILVLADSSYDPELKDIANDFLLTMDKMFFECEKWKNFEISNQKLHAETIFQLFKKMKEEN